MNDPFMTTGDAGQTAPDFAGTLDMRAMRVPLMTYPAAARNRRQFWTASSTSTSATVSGGPVWWLR